MPAPMAASAPAAEGHASGAVLLSLGSALLVVAFELPSVAVALLHVVVEFDCVEFEPRLSCRWSAGRPPGMLNFLEPLMHWASFELEQ